MQCANIYVRIVGWLSRGHSVHTTGKSLTEMSVCPVERMYSRVSNITHVTIYDNREHQRSAKASAATGAAIHQSNTTSAKARNLDSRVHTQIQQRSPIPCHNSESTKAQRPAGFVCAHAGDGRPYLAQGSSMQYNRRKQNQCACETVVRRKSVITNRVAYVLYAGLMPQRQAFTMFIIYCSKPQQTDAVTPTPLAHRSHSCMRALALGHEKDTQYQSAELPCTPAAQPPPAISTHTQLGYHQILSANAARCEAQAA